MSLASLLAYDPAKTIGPYFSRDDNSVQTMLELLQLARQSIVLSTHSLDSAPFTDEASAQVVTKLLLNKGSIQIVTDNASLLTDTDAPMARQLKQYAAHPDYTQRIHVTHVPSLPLVKNHPSECLVVDQRHYMTDYETANRQIYGVNDPLPAEFLTDRIIQAEASGTPVATTDPVTLAGFREALAEIRGHSWQNRVRGWFGLSPR